MGHEWRRTGRIKLTAVAECGRVRAQSGSARTPPPPPPLACARCAARRNMLGVDAWERELSGCEVGVSVCGQRGLSAMRPKALDENGAVREIDRPLRLLHCRCRSHCYCPSVKARASIACRPETTWKHSARIEWGARRIAAEESDEGARHGSQPPRICLTPALSLHRQCSALTSTLLLARVSRHTNGRRFVR